MDQTKEIFVDASRCTGCDSCKIACAVAHSNSKSLYEELAKQRQPKSRLYVEWIEPESKVPILCRHCEDAPCMHACIAGAIARSEDDAVVTDPDKCIGCWTCVMVCPYGVIGRNTEERKVYRCDRCPELPLPACVSACPTKALVYNTVPEFSKQVRKKAARELVSGKGA